MAPLSLLNFYFQFCPLLLPLFLHCSSLIISSLPHKIPLLSPFNREAILLRNHDKVLSVSEKAIDSRGYQTYFYAQTIDHFNYGPHSYDTFQQRYLVNSKFWKGPNSMAPIFAYLGAEQTISSDVENIGFLDENAPFFKSLSVFIEHRFYGESIPFGTMEEATKNATTRGYFSSAQALADYAEILLHIKDKYSAHKSPIIVIGGSYGGMLASWFRLKYPHIALGALASSSPILYFDNIVPQNGYYSVVTKNFEEASSNCAQTIRKSWTEIDKIASQPDGLSTLKQMFKSCEEFKNAEEIKNSLATMYTSVAQYNAPPEYPVTQLCKGIDQPSKDGANNIVGKIAAGITAFMGNATCQTYIRNPSKTTTGWDWQSCSEMLMPIGRGQNDTMFPAAPFSFAEHTKSCTKKFGVPPRPHWVTTYYGGHDIRLILKRFGSNIIFSNGLKDPYSIGGVLEDLSESLVAVTTRNGSHCLDILRLSETGSPDWLIMQRNIEIEIIQGWIEQYHHDIQSLF